MTVPSLSPSPFSHEQVAFCHDPATGLRAIIAHLLHRARSGASAGPGSTRMRPRRPPSPTCCDLSRGMAYKNAVAGLDHGGGKAVIIGDPRTDKSRGAAARLRPVRRRASAAATSPPATSAPTSRTWTSSRESTRFATGRTEAHGGAGDSSVLTAYGVFQGMRASAEHGGAAPSLRRPDGRGRRRRQGGPPAGRAPGRGRRRRRGHRRQRRGRRRRCARAPAGGGGAGRRGADRADLDVYAPCALGGALDDDDRRALQRGDRLRRGQQPARRTRASRRTARRSAGILYAPDYVVNAGGVIQVADELHGFDFERARAEGRADLRHHARRVRAADGRAGRAPRGRGRPARRGADGGGNAGRVWLPSR